jgi:hypothetical protein
MLRWIFLVRYPEGVPVEDGEAWYFDHHAREAKAMIGLRRYRTWALEPATVPGAGRPLEALNRWVRMSELAFDDFAAWEHAIVHNLPSFTPAPWADPEKGIPSYLSETIFVGDEPVDLLAEEH